MSGKIGRPPEDRLLRQREIFLAVAPLIMERGVGKVTMRDAAAAACLSLGGLHHYFSTKRDLVLHGLHQEAFDRVCHDFFAEYGHLEAEDPEGFVARYVEFQIDQVTFIGPSLHASLEMGAEVFLGEMEAGMQRGLDGFMAALRHIIPNSEVLDPRPLARGIRRTLLGALLDRSVTRGELREELWALIDAAQQRSSHFPTRRANQGLDNEPAFSE